jgi:hypothetical protein
LGLCWCGVLTLGVIIIYYILYYYILHIYYIIIYYYIILLLYTYLYSSSVLFFPYSSLIPFLLNLLFLLSSILYSIFFPFLIHSILVDTYIYLTIFLLPTPNLTPHKISEGCLEWCSFICVVFELVWC